MTSHHFSSTERIVLVVLLIVIGLSSRLLPHPPGATALSAIVFISSMFLGTRTAVAALLFLLVASDTFVGTYELPVMFSVYGSFLLIALIGRWFALHTSSWSARFLITLTPSLLFFLVTNATLWFFTPWYPKDMVGLLASYTMGLPFLRNMVIGDLVYLSALGGAVLLYARMRTALSHSTYEHA